MSWLSSLFSPPTPPDPAATSAAQAAANTAAATEQQKLNMTNQITPYGNYTYSPNATSPSGYDATLALSPAQQQLLNTQQNTQQNLGGAGQELTAQLAGLYGQPPNMGSAVNNLTNQIGALGMQTPNLDPSAMTSQMMNWGQQYMQPIFNQQQSNLNAQLQNQGVTPGSEAYNNAQNLQARNVNDAYTNLFMQAEPQAFSQAVTASQVPLNQALTAQQPLYNQAMQQYQLPLQTASNILGMAGATQPTLQQTPQVQVAQPSTYATTAQNAYQGQTSMDAAALQGLFGLAGNVAKGAGAAVAAAVA